MESESMGPEQENGQIAPGTEQLAEPDGAMRPEVLRFDAEGLAGHELNRVFFGPQGLRSGWSILVFVFLIYTLATIFGTLLSALVYNELHLRLAGNSAASTILGESQWVAALALAALIVARIEQHGVLDFYLRDRGGLARFASGAAAGFVALSAVVGGMAAGGWVHFGAVTLSGAQALKYAVMWGVGFLLVGLMEEGSFRCFLQYTLARGINFWWALAIESGFCIFLMTTAKGHGALGIYAMALAGVVPCLFLHIRKKPRGGFWQAAWVSSTGFGFIHTFNNGENWIGILAAAAIGFVFCVSVWVTGSAWWAIGCHASWDWAESFLYGTADSGFAARGHYLTSIPAGSALWSGGADGPEGSLLVLPVIGLLLLALMVIYGRPKAAQAPQTTAQQQLAG